MIIGKEASVGSFILHRVGATVEGSVLAEQDEEMMREEDQEFLRKLFLKPFATAIHTSEFTHAVGLEYNVLHRLCRSIQEEGEFVERSRDIAKHLIDSSQHHNIKSGDLFIARFSDVELGLRHYQAIGIYKYDSKEVFMETKVRGKSIELDLRKGLGSAKPNKACLVVFTEEAPTLFVLDDNDHTTYWQNDFIGLKAKKDNVNSTSNMLELTKSFITDQLPQNYEIAKADQIDLLNRSVNYFKSNTEYDQEVFEQTVFQEPKVIESFKRFGDEFKQTHALEMEPHFEISAQAVKKQARIFKSVLKLDKNFHIYIHGDRNKIERGTDESGRKFYKIYFEEEK